MLTGLTWVLNVEGTSFKMLLDAFQKKKKNVFLDGSLIYTAGYNMG